MKSSEIFEKMFAKYLIKKTIKNQIWSQKTMVELIDDEFTTIDDNATYIIDNGILYIAIKLPKALKDVVKDENLSGSGKTYRVYSNSTNRKFIKDEEFKDVQIQINGYLSVKDSKKL